MFIIAVPIVVPMIILIIFHFHYYPRCPSLFLLSPLPLLPLSEGFAAAASPFFSHRGRVCLLAWEFGSSNFRSLGSWVARSVGLVDWSAGSLPVWLAGWWAALPAGWLAGLLVGWLAG